MIDAARLLKRFDSFSLSLSLSLFFSISLSFLFPVPQSFLEGMIRTALRASLIYLSSLLRRD